MKTLQKLRGEIDDIDKQILFLLNNRAKLAVEIGKTKQRQEENISVYRPAREDQILKNLISQNTGPLQATDIQNIFRAIIIANRSVQEPK